jgi:type I restriction enzyme M protein
MSNPTALVQKLWNYCNILRDDGLSYGDLASQTRHQFDPQNTTCALRIVVVEQLTFLLFLKMADEQARPPFNKVAEPSRLCSGESISGGTPLPL